MIGKNSHFLKSTSDNRRDLKWGRNIVRTKRSVKSLTVNNTASIFATTFFSVLANVILTCLVWLTQVQLMKYYSSRESILRLFSVPSCCQHIEQWYMKEGCWEPWGKGFHFIKVPEDDIWNSLTPFIPYLLFHLAFSAVFNHILTNIRVINIPRTTEQKWNLLHT